PRGRGPPQRGRAERRRRVRTAPARARRAAEEARRTRTRRRTRARARRGRRDGPATWSGRILRRGGAGPAALPRREAGVVAEGARDVGGAEAIATHGLTA